MDTNYYKKKCIKYIRKLKKLQKAQNELKQTGGSLDLQERVKEVEQTKEKLEEAIKSQEAIKSLSPDYSSPLRSRHYDFSVPDAPPPETQHSHIIDSNRPLPPSEFSSIQEEDTRKKKRLDLQERVKEAIQEVEQTEEKLKKAIKNLSPSREKKLEEVEFSSIQEEDPREKKLEALFKNFTECIKNLFNEYDEFTTLNDNFDKCQIIYQEIVNVLEIPNEFDLEKLKELKELKEYKKIFTNQKNIFSIKLNNLEKKFQKLYSYEDDDDEEDYEELLKEILEAKELKKNELLKEKEQKYQELLKEKTLERLEAKYLEEIKYQELLEQKTSILNLDYYNEKLFSQIQHIISLINDNIYHSLVSISILIRTIINMYKIIDILFNEEYLSIENVYFEINIDSIKKNFLNFLLQQEEIYNELDLSKPIKDIIKNDEFDLYKLIDILKDKKPDINEMDSYKYIFSYLNQILVLNKSLIENKRNSFYDYLIDIDKLDQHQYYKDRIEELTNIYSSLDKYSKNKSLKDYIISTNKESSNDQLLGGRTINIKQNHNNNLNNSLSYFKKSKQFINKHIMSGGDITIDYQDNISIFDINSKFREYDIPHDFLHTTRVDATDVPIIDKLVQPSLFNESAAKNSTLTDALLNGILYPYSLYKFINGLIRYDWGSQKFTKKEKYIKGNIHNSIGNLDEGPSFCIDGFEHISSERKDEAEKCCKMLTEYYKSLDPKNNFEFKINELKEWTFTLNGKKIILPNGIGHVKKLAKEIVLFVKNKHSSIFYPFRSVLGSKNIDEFAKILFDLKTVGDMFQAMLHYDTSDKKYNTMYYQTHDSLNGYGTYNSMDKHKYQTEAEENTKILILDCIKIPEDIMSKLKLSSNAKFYVIDKNQDLKYENYCMIALLLFNCVQNVKDIDIEKQKNDIEEQKNELQVEINKVKEDNKDQKTHEREKNLAKFCKTFISNLYKKLITYLDYDKELKYKEELTIDDNLEKLYTYFETLIGSIEDLFNKDFITYINEKLLSDKLDELVEPFVPNSFKRANVALVDNTLSHNLSKNDYSVFNPIIGFLGLIIFKKKESIPLSKISIIDYFNNMIKMYKPLELIEKKLIEERKEGEKEKKEEGEKGEKGEKEEKEENYIMKFIEGLYSNYGLQLQNLKTFSESKQPKRLVSGTTTGERYYKYITQSINDNNKKIRGKIQKMLAKLKTKQKYQIYKDLFIEKTKKVVIYPSIAFSSKEYDLDNLFHINKSTIESLNCFVITTSEYEDIKHLIERQDEEKAEEIAEKEKEGGYKSFVYSKQKQICNIFKIFLDVIKDIFNSNNRSIKRIDKEEKTQLYCLWHTYTINLIYCYFKIFKNIPEDYKRELQIIYDNMSEIKIELDKKLKEEDKVKFGLKGTNIHDEFFNNLLKNDNFRNKSLNEITAESFEDTPITNFINTVTKPELAKIHTVLSKYLGDKETSSKYDELK